MAKRKPKTFEVGQIYRPEYGAPDQLVMIVEAKRERNPYRPGRPYVKRVRIVTSDGEQYSGLAHKSDANHEYFVCGPGCYLWVRASCGLVKNVDEAIIDRFASFLPTEAAQ